MSDDPRLDYPATGRNREFIRDVLREVLPARGTVLEIASGSGQHAAFFASTFSHLRWQPSDLDADLFASIRAWSEGLDNVAEPVAANWADLTDGTLERTLGTTEFGQVRDRYEGVAAEFAWTGSTAAGLPVGLHCAGWTDSSTGRGATGNTGAINTTWSDLGNGLGVYCYHPARLYCIEQGAD